MGKHKTEGKNFYLRVTEPIKFVRKFLKNIEKSKEKGFKVKIYLGGPEEFPVHIFNETDISSNKFLLFLYGVSYWTHIALDVKGGTDEENAREIDNLLSGIEDEVTPF
ncbi:MAG: hypothetical protein N3E50_09775 [Candidatus Goldbacteria bacterium]|nr:hypothetical protein [Candidatus Goldiibacteriota bacterium]